VALINAAPSLDHLLTGDDAQTGDIKTGVQILRRALEEPMRQLAENAGEDGAVAVQEVRRRQKDSGNLNIGYNVMTEDYADLMSAGIIDPAKVTRSALQNAASIAAMILTTEALITDAPEKDKAPAAPPMPDY
jgi:chaperonin GroEL